MTSEEQTRINNHGFYSKQAGISEFFHEHNDNLRIFVNCFDEWVFHFGWSPDGGPPIISKDLDDIIQAYFNYRDKRRATLDG